MQKEELQQKIAEYYAKLPKEAQAVFSSMAWLSKLEEISKKYNLSDNQTQTLTTETMLALLGIIDLNEFEKNINNELKTSRYIIDEILVEVDNYILKNIRGDLMNAFERNNTEEDYVKENEKEVLDEKFSNLTEETQEAVNESNYKEKLIEIGKKYNLTVSQMGILGESVEGVLLGDIPATNFENSLNDLILPIETKNSLINETNEKIFKIIRENLITSINESKKENEKEDGMEDIESRDELLKAISFDNTPQKIETKSIPNENKKEKSVALEEFELELKAGDATKPETVLENSVIKEEKISEEEKPVSILSQKLGGSYETPKTETEHSISSVLKKTVEKTGLPKVDPYRETVE